ncbi:MAG: hypothetical protein OEY38_13245 [Gammaproteobacteria bacterium]|nr:hypothetical protein [Gammaproteobacteria bacterium]
MRSTAIFLASLILLVFISGCSIGQLKPPKLNENPAAVIFSVYILETSTKGEAKALEHVSLTGVRLVEEDKKTGEVVYARIDDDNYKIFGHNVIAVTGLTPGKKYSLAYIAFEQKQANAKVLHAYNLDYKTTLKKTPLVAKKGKVTFAGVQGVNIRVRKKRTFTAPRQISLEVIKGEKALAQLSEAGIYGTYTTWAKQAIFGYGKKHDAKAAEKNALESVLFLQKDPYWKQAIQNALKQCRCA